MSFVSLLQTSGEGELWVGVCIPCRPLLAVCQSCLPAGDITSMTGHAELLAEDPFIELHAPTVALVPGLSHPLLKPKPKRSLAYNPALFPEAMCMALSPKPVPCAPSKSTAFALLFLGPSCPCLLPPAPAQAPSPQHAAD